MFDWLRSRLRLKRAADSQGLIADHAAVLQLAEKTSAQDIASAQTEFKLGNLQRQANQRDRAEQHYRRALALHPAFAEACANLGSLLNDRAQVVEADR